MNVDPFEDLDLKIKEKTKQKLYKNNFLDQFMNNEKFSERKIEEKNLLSEKKYENEKKIQLEDFSKNFSFKKNTLIEEDENIESSDPFMSKEYVSPIKNQNLINSLEECDKNLDDINCNRDNLNIDFLNKNLHENRNEKKSGKLYSNFSNKFFHSNQIKKNDLKIPLQRKTTDYSNNNCKKKDFQLKKNNIINKHSSSKFGNVKYNFNQKFQNQNIFSSKKFLNINKNIEKENYLDTNESSNSTSYKNTDPNPLISSHKLLNDPNGNLLEQDPNHDKKENQIVNMLLNKNVILANNNRLSYKTDKNSNLQIYKNLFNSKEKIITKKIRSKDHTNNSYNNLKLKITNGIIIDKNNQNKNKNILSDKNLIKVNDREKHNITPNYEDSKNNFNLERNKNKFNIFKNSNKNAKIIDKINHNHIENNNYKITNLKDFDNLMNVYDKEIQFNYIKNDITNNIFNINTNKPKRNYSNVKSRYMQNITRRHKTVDVNDSFEKIPSNLYEFTIMNDISRLNLNKNIPEKFRNKSNTSNNNSMNILINAKKNNNFSPKLKNFNSQKNNLPEICSLNKKNIREKNQDQLFTAPQNYDRYNKIIDNIQKPYDTEFSVNAANSVNNIDSIGDNIFKNSLKIETENLFANMNLNTTENNIDFNEFMKKNFFDVPHLSNTTTNYNYNNSNFDRSSFNLYNKNIEYKSNFNSASTDNNNNLINGNTVKNKLTKNKYRELIDDFFKEDGS